MEQVKQKLTKTKTGWAVFNRRGYLYEDTIRLLRKEAIRAFLTDVYSIVSWADCKRKYGVYAAKVEIRWEGNND